MRELFKKDLAKSAEAFKGFEAVKAFALVSEDFTTDNGLLTPSLKVKRRKVFEKYEAQLLALYPSK